MRSIGEPDPGDLTAKARIRDAALRLFAAQGSGSVSLRRVAAAAGVSPGLVLHHYRSRQGLREAVDGHMAALFDRLFGQVTELEWDAAGGSFAELITTALPADSPVPRYLRRLLTDGDPVGRELFARWYAIGKVALEQLRAAGVIRPVGDPDVVAAFLMVNDLALLLLREHLQAVLGIDPLSREGLASWVDSAMAVYRDGLFVAEASGTEVSGTEASGTETSGTEAAGRDREGAGG